MSLKIYNTLTRQKEIFKPLVDGKVSLYVCGITVYDYCHLGHARTYMSFDMVVRYLGYLDYQVHYIRNITDIDDKIIRRANEKGEALTVITERFINAMHDDDRALGLLSPNEEPRATQHMAQIITMIACLLAKGIAYIGGNGDVFYSINTFKTYGLLSRKDIAGLQAGERVAVDNAKKQPLDFVLWKLAKPNEPCWDSPWGKGRPGWHIECSAMATHCLGDTFDIHGGGFDLQFPHHENEIAQSEAATDKKFVNTWMHVGFLNIAQEKMSKSLNNFLTIREVLEQHHPEVIRYFMLSSHYRSALNYSQDNLHNAHAALQRLYNAIRDITPSVEFDKNSRYEQRFRQAMDDDFNTPEAMAVLFDVVRAIHKARQQDLQQHAKNLAGILRHLANVLGLLQCQAQQFFQGDDVDKASVEALIAEREQARANNDWQTSDRIRDQLRAKNILLEDKSQGTIWRKAT